MNNGQWKIAAFLPLRGAGGLNNLNVAVQRHRGFSLRLRVSAFKSLND
jgi:hypothetical protein